ncbi:hypothetical protein AWB81_07481 [Caballeronia arationis]|uniref:hypothetical protein n=1 Tax=Caballeronia arationis TaxID=1777142 RepID=UPI00074CEB19|nr:hypothetical protein [Caballeronia arationis]SAL06184.1 hypothetical protein AWB81_07481 [Caballeronia arationis]
MAQTLVAVFDSYADAQAAAGRLEADGIARSDLNIHARDDVGADLPAQGFAGTADDVTPRDVTVGRSSGEAEGGAMARIEHFFKNLFGDDDGPEEAGHYREAVRRGGAVLTKVAHSRKHLRMSGIAIGFSLHCFAMARRSLCSSDLTMIDRSPALDKKATALIPPPFRSLIRCIRAVAHLFGGGLCIFDRRPRTRCRLNAIVELPRRGD